MGTIAIEERGVTAAFFFGQYIYFTFEFGVRMNAAGFGQYLAAFDFFAVNTTQQAADVVASYCFVEQFAEHFNAGYNGGFLFFFHANDFNGVANLDGATLNTAGSYGATTGDGEYVFDRHQEGFVGCTFRQRNVAVNCIHQFHDLCFVFGVAFQSFQSGASDYGDVIAGEVIGAQQFANFHFYQFQQLFVVNHVNLVQEYNHSGNAYLASQQDVLTGLGHGAVSSGYYQDCAVHLSSAGDHVLYIVSMARAVNVCIVTGFGLIFNVCGVDGDAAFTFFRSFIDHGVVHEFCAAAFSQNLGDSCGQGGLAMVNVTDGADIQMGFSSFIFSFCHCEFPP